MSPVVSRTLGQDHRLPGWPEVSVAVPAAAVLYMVGAVAALRLPPGCPISPGQANFLVSGLAPLGAFALATLIRFRDVRPFGVRRTDARWLVVALGIGLACFVLSWPVSALFDPFFPGSESVQQGYRDAASAGLSSLVVTVALGGLLTPLGEEALFRGVLAQFLSRWGTWIGLLVSAALFALAHGINAVMPLAFVIGLSTGLLLQLSGSIWPGVLVHAVYNSLGIFYHAVAGG